MSDVVAWPEGINQCPLLEDYKSDQVESRLISNVDAGLRKIRNRYLAVPTNTTESFILTRQQYNAWLTWFNDVARRGGKRFTKYEPMSDAVKEYRFRTPPSISPIGGNRVKLSLELEIMP